MTDCNGGGAGSRLTPSGPRLGLPTLPGPTTDPNRPTTGKEGQSLSSNETQVSDAPSLGSPHPGPCPRCWVRRRPRTAPDTHLQQPNPACPALWTVFPSAWPVTPPAKYHLQRGDQPLLRKAPSAHPGRGKPEPSAGPSRSMSQSEGQWPPPSAPFRGLLATSPVSLQDRCTLGRRLGVGGRLPHSSVSDGAGVWGHPDHPACSPAQEGLEFGREATHVSQGLSH